jgi:parvulin-like peptidyl-prolyl isomerase
MERGRRTLGWVLGVAMAGGMLVRPAEAQQAARTARGAAAETKRASVDHPNPSPRLDQIDVPALKLTAVPVNPSDPIAIVNNQVISRQQLADECVARKGKEILETLINRTLIEQALKARKLEVTAAEIDQEIDNVARRFGIGREAWLRTLDKERGISPIQYARDVIYPALALRKLSVDRVQVTPKDLQDAFEAQYGEKLRCRMIMVDKLSKAQDLWEQLRKNPGGFEKLAQDHSMDPGSRSLGGLLAEPITRHAYPQNVSDAAFRQLVDGDPDDKDPAHKPKNGDFTGPIQAAESVWVILRREGVIPAVPNVSLKDEQIKKQTYEMIYEVKLKEMMGIVFQELVKASAIENKLVGTIKLANEEEDPAFRVDQEVKLMGHRESSSSDSEKTTSTAAPADAQKLKLPTPAAVAPEAAEKFENLKQRLPRPAANPSPAPPGDQPRR